MGFGVYWVSVFSGVRCLVGSVFSGVRRLVGSVFSRFGV